MKTKGFMWITLVFLTLILCAFVIFPVVRLTAPDGSAIDLTFKEPQQTEDGLILTVDYDAYGSFFEIGKDLEVYADAEKNTPLKMMQCIPNDGEYTYIFSLVDNIDTIWVVPPILYIPEQIEPVYCAAEAGSVAEGTDGLPWFTITGSKAVKNGEHACTVSIVIEPASSDLPRFPKLIIEDQELGGTAAMNFDNDGTFISGEFQYIIKAADVEEAEEIVRGSKIVVCDKLKMVKAEGLDINSKDVALKVIEVK